MGRDERQMTEEHKMNLTILGAAIIIIGCLCTKEYETRKKGTLGNGTRQPELCTTAEAKSVVQVRSFSTSSSISEGAFAVSTGTFSNATEVVIENNVGSMSHLR